MDILRIRNEKGEWVGIPAIKGENAYEIAVAHGYEGTQEEWLASLKGDKGDKGDLVKVYPFVAVDFAVGKTAIMPVYWAGYEDEEEHPNKDDYLADDWKVGDILLSENGKMMAITEITKWSEYKWDVFIRCFADIKGKDAIVDTDFDYASENAISNRTVTLKVNELGSVMGMVEGTSARTDLSNVSDEDFRTKAESAGVGGGGAGVAGSGGAGLKRIGFTADCDYVATSNDGRAAFMNAINGASDGDIIMVMPGYYGGTDETPINKDITFVGIGKPKIAFPITIGTTSQAYSVNFDNFHFVKAITCTKVDEYTSSMFYAYNSRFDGNTVTILGSFSNCKIDYAKVYGSLPYYGDASLCAINYNDCTIANSTVSGDGVNFRNCIIRESSTPTGYAVGYTDCSLYNFTSKMGAAYQTYFDRCVIYGTSLPTSDYGPYYNDCYVVAGESI